MLDGVPDLEPLFDNEAERVASHLSLLDGFGTRPQVEFPLTGPLDPASVPGSSDSIDAPALVINIDAQSPQRGQVMAYEWRYDAEELTLKGAPVPGTVLDSGTTYAAVATIDLLTLDGAPMSPSPGRPTARPWAARVQRKPGCHMESSAGVAASLTASASSPQPTPTPSKMTKTSGPLRPAKEEWRSSFNIAGTLARNEQRRHPKMPPHMV